MSDDDRLDRAKRIRERRERGSRDAESDDESQDEEEATEEWGETLSDDPGEQAADDDAESSAEPQSEGEETTVTTAAVATEDGDDEATADHEDESLPESEGGAISAPLPEADQLEEALESSGAESEAETVAPGIEEEEAESAQEETRVLEFTLEDEHYCLDIEYIEEIVKEETITRVPNAPAYVEGVVDLRGQITTILNPKVTIGKEETEPGGLIIVFDADSFDDQGNIGWVVDDVRQVTPITDADVNEPPIDDEHVLGVIDRDDHDEFVIWTTPELGFDGDS